MENKQPKFMGGIMGGLVAALIVCVPLLLLVAMVIWIVRLILLGLGA